MLELDNKRLEQSGEFLYLNVLEYEKKAISSSTEHGVNFIEKRLSLSLPSFPFSANLCTISSREGISFKVAISSAEVRLLYALQRCAITLTKGCVIFFQIAI